MKTKNRSQRPPSPELRRRLRHMRNDPLRDIAERRNERNLERIDRALRRSEARDELALCKEYGAAHEHIPGAGQDPDRFIKWVRAQKREHPEKFKPRRTIAERVGAEPAPKAPPPYNFKPKAGGETVEERAEARFRMAARLQELGLRTVPPEFAPSAAQYLAHSGHDVGDPIRPAKLSDEAKARRERQDKLLKEFGITPGAWGIVPGTGNNSGSGLGQ